MTALPIDPTDEQLFAVVTVEPDTTEGKWRRAFQAGVEAERARAAAETTEEWGTRRDDEQFAPVPELSEKHARSLTDKRPSRVAVRRLVGPWEVQS